MPFTDAANHVGEGNTRTVQKHLDVAAAVQASELALYRQAGRVPVDRSPPPGLLERRPSASSTFTRAAKKSACAPPVTYAFRPVTTSAVSLTGGPRRPVGIACGCALGERPCPTQLSPHQWHQVTLPQVAFRRVKHARPGPEHFAGQPRVRRRDSLARDHQGQRRPRPHRRTPPAALGRKCRPHESAHAPRGV